MYLEGFNFNTQEWELEKENGTTVFFSLEEDISNFGWYYTQMKFLRWDESLILRITKAARKVAESSNIQLTFDNWGEVTEPH